MKVKINDIAGELEMTFDEQSSFYNTDDGTIYVVSNEEMSAAEEGYDLEDYPNWQQENIKIAERILSEDSFIELPSKYDIHEYEIMERFCYSIDDQRISESLQIAIQGKGAFRRFKDTCHNFGVIESWWVYKKEALKEIVVLWCVDNNLEYEE